MPPASDLLGQLAISGGFVDTAALALCLEQQKQSAAKGIPVPIGQILIARGHLDRQSLADLLALQRRMRAVSRGDAGVGADGKTAVSAEARAFGASGRSAPVLEPVDGPDERGDDLTALDVNVAKAGLEVIARSARRAVPEAPDGSAAPPRIGGYVLEMELSRGGMGTVYLARKEGEERWVALKILNAAGDQSDELVVRFRREARFLLSLDHPHIVAAYEVGSDGGRHFLSMEYVQGEDLATRVTRGGPLGVLDALAKMRQAADALLYAERSGIVHRDVKPSNVLIRQDGLVKLADLGLAILVNREDLRLTGTGTVVGTPAYMSPEQIQSSRDIDSRSDIYSLGCTFFFALCGGPPFEGETLEICQKKLREEPPWPASRRPGLPSDIEMLLLRCMQREREARFQSFGDLIAALDDLIASFGPPASVPGRGAPGRPGRVEDQFGFQGPASR